MTSAIKTLPEQIQIDEFLSREEIQKRRALGYKYFQIGRLYQVKKDFIGLKEVGKERRQRIDVYRGDFLLCTKSEPFLRSRGETSWKPKTGPVGEVMFLYNESLLRYVTDCFSLCCMLDLVENGNNE